MEALRSIKAREQRLETFKEYRADYVQQDVEAYKQVVTGNDKIARFKENLANRRRFTCDRE